MTHPSSSFAGQVHWNLWVKHKISFIFHSGRVPPIGTNVGSVSLTVYLNYIKDRQLKAVSSKSFLGKKICKTQANSTTCNHGFENTEGRMSC